MGPNYKHNRLSGYFTNLTDSVVNLYECSSGEIWTFPPSTDPLPKAPTFEPDAPLLHYIVTPEMAEKIKNSGRSLEDIAIAISATHGRHELTITDLRWGKNPDIIVRLYRNYRK